MEPNEQNKLTKQKDSEVQRTDSQLSQGGGGGWVKKVMGLAKGKNTSEPDNSVVLSRREGGGGGRGG